VSEQTRLKKAKLIRSWIPALVLLLLSALLLLLKSRSREAFFGTIGTYTLEMVTIFPAVLVMMGLLSAFVSNQFIVRHLGEESGIRGMVLAFLLGTLPTGPLYIAFPLAASLKKLW